MFHLLVIAAGALLLPTAPRMATPLHMCRGATTRMQSEWSADDDASLRDAIERASSTKLGPPHTVLEGMGSAYVLIFNVGQQDEGVYTLQGRASAASAYVLAFERDDDADRFSQLLQAEGFDLATPLSWDVNQLANFCSAGRFEVSLVPQGTLITPPAKNEYDKDAFDRISGDAPAIDIDMNEVGINDFDPSTRVSERERFERLFRQED